MEDSMTTHPADLHPIIEGPETLARTLNLYRPRMLKLAGSWLGKDRAFSEDLVQDALVKAYTGLSRFRGDAALATWVIRILVNEVRMWRRRQRTGIAAITQATLLETIGQRDHHCRPVLERMENEARQQAFRKAIHGLAPKYREALELCCLEGLSHADAARRLGLTVSTVKTRVFRARHMIASAPELRGWI
jgi:RNA polymerase sigma factor (sigma-70 family)